MMTNDIRKSQLLSILAIVSIIALVNWLDTVSISWHRQARAAFDMGPFLYFYFALPFLFAILAIFLSWLLLVRFKSTWVTLTFCLLIGITFMFFAMSMASGNTAFIDVMNNLHLVFLSKNLLQLGSGSMTLQIGAFILVIGLINLIRTLAVKMQKSL